MGGRSSTTFAKLQKERARREKQAEKEQRRRQRSLEKKAGVAGGHGEADDDASEAQPAREHGPESEGVL